MLLALITLVVCALIGVVSILFVGWLISIHDSRAYGIARYPLRHRWRRRSES